MNAENEYFFLNTVLVVNRDKNWIFLIRYLYKNFQQNTQECFEWDTQEDT